MVESLVLFQSSDVDAPSLDFYDSQPNTTTTAPNFDFIGPEMADLQQLLVSMVTGKGIEIAYFLTFSVYIYKKSHLTLFTRVELLPCSGLLAFTFDK